MQDWRLSAHILPDCLKPLKPDQTSSKAWVLYWDLTPGSIFLHYIQRPLMSRFGHSWRPEQPVFEIIVNLDTPNSGPDEGYWCQECSQQKVRILWWKNVGCYQNILCQQRLWWQQNIHSLAIAVRRGPVYQFRVNINTMLSYHVKRGEILKWS